jgi:immune inhibitor A
MFSRQSLPIISFSLALLASAPALAVPAPPFPIQLENEDGSVLWGRMFGDEHLSWLEDLAGFSLAFDPNLGAWCYAELAEDGRLQPTLIRAGSVEPASLGFERHLRPSPEVRREVRARRDARTPSPLPAPPPSPGVVPNLVLLVRFANQTTTFQPADFEPVFNGASGSVQAYYREVSFERITLQSTMTSWLALPNNDLYYAYNDQVYNNPDDMVRHAVQILNGQGFDFTRFDQNPRDGTIDAITVIHSGGGYENTGNRNHIHSHYSPLYPSLTTHDGIRINAYHTAPELRSGGTRITQIGVIVHETAHFFGLPDLYDYDGDSSGVGMWCLMASGPWAGPGMDGTVPTHLSAWGKYKLGFISPTVLQASTANLVVHPASQNPEALLLNTGMPTRQYFIAENRQMLGFDAHLPGEGLLIYHVDENQRDNDDQNHYLVDVEQADGRRDLNTNPYNQGDWGDAWPNGSKNLFGPSSTPNSIAYGQSTSRITLYGITRQADDVLLGVDLSGTTESFLALSPASLTFHSTSGGADPPAQNVAVNHQGANPLSWSASAAAPWLRVSSSSGSTPGATSVSAVITGLAAGSHQGSVVFTSPGAANSPQTLTVNLQLDSQPPVFQVTPARLDFRAVAGRAAPASQTLLVENTGGGSLIWTASLDFGATWALLSRSAGQAPTQVAVGADTAGLAAGNYAGILTLSAPGAQSASVPLTLVLDPPPRLAVAPARLAFEGVAGGPPPAAQTVQIRNATTGDLAFSLSCSPAWLHCAPTTGATPMDIQVTVDPAFMAAGQHMGSLVVEATEADNGPLVVQVDLRLADPNLPPGRPTPLSPSALSNVEQLFPELTVLNAADPDGDALAYEFELISYPDLEVVEERPGVPEGTSYTSVRVGVPLELRATYQWRARAVDEHGLAGAWTEYQLFSVVPPSSSGCASAGDRSGAGLAALGLLALGWLGRRRQASFRSPGGTRRDT